MAAACDCSPPLAILITNKITLTSIYRLILQADGVGMFSVGFGDISDLTEIDAYSSNPTSDYEILIRSQREIGEVPGLMVYRLKRGMYVGEM